MVRLGRGCGSTTMLDFVILGIVSIGLMLNLGVPVPIGFDFVKGFGFGLVKDHRFGVGLLVSDVKVDYGWKILGSLKSRWIL